MLQSPTRSLATPLPQYVYLRFTSALHGERARALLTQLKSWPTQHYTARICMGATVTKK